MLRVCVAVSASFRYTYRRFVFRLFMGCFLCEVAEFEMEIIYDAVGKTKVFNVLWALAIFEL